MNLNDSLVQRRNMIDSQLKPNKVTDTRLLAVMATIPREKFLPAALAGIAYMDENIALLPGRYLIEPMVLALMIQALEPEAGMRALVIGAGAGYGSAILAALGLKVTALESDRTLSELARNALSTTGYGNVRIVTGPLVDGLKDEPPFDIILIEGQISVIPPNLLEQMAENGRLVGGVLRNGSGIVLRISKRDGGLSEKKLFDAAIPPLPDFATPAKFQF